MIDWYMNSNQLNWRTSQKWINAAETAQNHTRNVCKSYSGGRQIILQWSNLYSAM